MSFSKEEALNRFLDNHPHFQYAKKHFDKLESDNSMYQTLNEGKSHDDAIYEHPKNKESYYEGVQRRRLGREERLRQEALAQQRIVHERKVARLERIATRVERIAEMRENGNTLEKIGAAEGVSRERIRQILEQFRPDLLGRLTKKTISRLCGNCGVETKRTDCETNRKKKQWYCTTECSIQKNRKFTSSAERLRTYREKRKRQWREDPVYRAKQTAYVKARYLRTRNDPEVRAKESAYQKEYRIRKLKDPVWAAKYREKTAARSRERTRIKNEQMVDEIFYAAKQKGLL